MLEHSVTSADYYINSVHWINTCSELDTITQKETAFQRNLFSNEEGKTVKIILKLLLNKMMIFGSIS